MARCIDCVHYPWQRDADPTYLPVQRCHPKLRARRWNLHTLTEPIQCPLFEPIEGAQVDPVTVPEPEPDPEPAAATSEGAEAEAGAGGDDAAGNDGGTRVFNLPPKAQTKRVKQKGGGDS